MKISKIYKNIITEALIDERAIGKHLVVVDFQPEYQKLFGDMTAELAEYINENYENFNRLTFFYNGESLGMINESDFRIWWVDQGLNEDIAYNVRVYDKGYAFFRYCIDEGIEEESIVNLVKFMIKNNINDSRDINREFWEEFINQYGNEDIRELMEFSDNCISIPDLMDEMKDYHNVILTGGGINECLKEVEIALQALDKTYSVWYEFTY